MESAVTWDENNGVIFGKVISLGLVLFSFVGVAVIYEFVIFYKKTSTKV